MLIDGLFLIQLLPISINEKDETRRLCPHLALPSPFPSFVDQKLYSSLIDGNLMTQDEIVKDILKLENQIPLLVLKHILPHKFGNKLDVLFFKFCDFVSPKRLPPHDIPEFMRYRGYTDLSKIFDQSHHLLHFLYLLILDTSSSIDCPVGVALCSASLGVELLNALASVLQIAFLQQLSEAVGLIKTLFGLLGRVGSSSPSTGQDMSSPPLIPSATELRRVGVKLQGNYQDFCDSIRFEQEPRKVCLELPTITVNAFSEVVFRNLIAFEAASKVKTPWVGYYVALMSGLISTANDVKILKEEGMIEKHSGSEEEVVKVFGGLRNVLELHQQSYKYCRIMDMGEIKIVKDINSYYESCWKVKAKRFVNAVVKLMFVVVVILLVVAVVVRTFCGWFGCSRILDVWFLV